jgi:hypothetical protein
MLCVVLAVFAGCEQEAGTTPNQMAVETPEDEPVTLTGIAIASPPKTLYYARGVTKLDTEGLEVDGTFSDGTTQKLEDGYTLTILPSGLETPGPKYVEVRAGELTSAFSIIVNNTDSVLEAITAEAPEGGLVHDLGDNFNSAGLNVMGTFKDSAGNIEERPLSVFSVSGYNGAKRGEQTVTVSANGKTDQAQAVVRVPASATITSASTVGTNPGSYGHNTAFIKGQALDLANAKFRIGLTVNGRGFSLLNGDYDGDGEPDGIYEGDEIDFDPDISGFQTVTVTLDEKEVPVDVYVADAAPEVYFDYGFWRHADDPDGLRGGDGYHTVPGQAVVLSPARALIGYGSDNSDLGVEYAWTVTPLSDGTAVVEESANKEFLTLTPQAVGNWDVSVTVTGRNFIDGETVSMSAATVVVCDPAATPSSTSFNDIKNFAPGQFTEGGTGAGWSLGTIGGYWIRAVSHKDSYRIKGNAFGSWTEPGVVWFQQDLNGNNKPDEVWYELYAGTSTARAPVTRRYSVTFFRSDNPGSSGEAGYGGQILRGIYWVDCKGRTGKIPGGWPGNYGAPNYKGAKVTYTCTLLSDTGAINSEGYGGVLPEDGGPFVDHYGEDFPINRAAAADGRPVTLTGVRFVKVHTGLFCYGGVFGEISTEIDKWG